MLSTNKYQIPQIYVSDDEPKHHRAPTAKKACFLMNASNTPRKKSKTCKYHANPKLPLSLTLCFFLFHQYKKKTAQNCRKQFANTSHQLPINCPSTPDPCRKHAHTYTRIHTHTEISILYVYMCVLGRNASTQCCARQTRQVGEPLHKTQIGRHGTQRGTEVLFLELDSTTVVERKLARRTHQRT